MTDEGFREIQLNGKQLVFLFMAATVVSVVIFLCGVLVGRGVRGSTATVEIASADIGPDPSPRESMVPPENTTPQPTMSAPAGTPAGSGGATAPAEELSYAERLLREPPLRNTSRTRPASPPSPSRRRHHCRDRRRPCRSPSRRRWRPRARPHLRLPRQCLRPQQRLRPPQHPPRQIPPAQGLQCRWRSPRIVARLTHWPKI